MNHILMGKMRRYKVPEGFASPEGFAYDAGRGYWISTINGVPLVSDETVRKPMTKKADVETGEDKKGE